MKDSARGIFYGYRLASSTWSLSISALFSRFPWTFSHKIFAIVLAALIPPFPSHYSLYLSSHFGSPFIVFSGSSSGTRTLLSSQLSGPHLFSFPPLDAFSIQVLQFLAFTIERAAAIEESTEIPRAESFRAGLRRDLLEGFFEKVNTPPRARLARSSRRPFFSAFLNARQGAIPAPPPSFSSTAASFNPSTLPSPRCTM